MSDTGFLALAAAVASAGLVAVPSATHASADPCSAAATRAVVRALVGATNAGDLDRVDRLVAKGAAFKWYSSEDRIGEAARDRTTLRSYLAARHAQGERHGLVRFLYRSAGRMPVGGEFRRSANFEMEFVRRARDRAPAWVEGKGATDCKRRPARVAVWSLGSGQRLAQHSPRPRPVRR